MLNENLPQVIAHWIERAISLLETVAQAIRAETNASNHLPFDAPRALPRARHPPSPRLRRTGWLLFGSKDTGHQAAVIYTLVENCKRRGVPVEPYLLTGLPTTTDAQTLTTLTPASIAAARCRKPDAA